MIKWLTSLTGNSANFEPLLESMLGIAEDASEPSSQKAAFVFFTKCVTCWGQPITENAPDQEGLPGFDRFIYERIVPLAFRVPSSPNFNLKDGQVIVVRMVLLNEHERNVSMFYRLYKRSAIYFKPYLRHEVKKLPTSSSLFSSLHKTGHPKQPWNA